MSAFLRPGRNFDFKKFGEVSSLAMILPSSIAVGLVIGYYLDRWLKTEPWMLLAWTVLGVVSGIMNLWRGVKRYLGQNDTGGNKPRNSQERQG
ncbi:MAG: AtpZ/AtpI family protein [Candidatus Saccharicenans sp.]